MTLKLIEIPIEIIININGKRYIDKEILEMVEKGIDKNIVLKRQEELDKQR